MNRRDVLRGASLATLTGLAGCTGVLGGSGGTSTPNTYLPRPSDQKAKSENLVYPAWGQQFPTSTLPAVFHDGSVTMPGDFSGKNFFAVWFYSHCPTVCPVEISDMRSLQTKALQASYDTRFVAATFNPTQDTKSRLKAYAKEKYVNLNAGDWYFLRPTSEKAAKPIATGKYGIKFGKSYEQNGTQYYHHGAIIFLVNGNGHVERTYHSSLNHKVQWQPMWKDLKALRKKEGKSV